MADTTTPVQAFLDAHKQTQRDAAAGSGLHLSQINAMARGAIRSRTDTVNRFLSWCKTLDPSITYEDLFGPIPAQDQQAPAEGEQEIAPWS